MKMGKLVLLPLCIVLALSGCGILQAKKDPEKMTSRRKTSYDHFGSVCFAAAYDSNSDADKARFESAWGEIDAMLTELENSVSFDIPGSDIQKFNEAKYGQSVAVTPVTAEIMTLAIEMYKFTEGVFNPAVANLVDLWGFSPRFRKNSDGKMPYDRPRNPDGSFDLPDGRYILAFQKLSDFSCVQLSGNKDIGYLLTKNAKDIEVDGAAYPLKIDLGGIAKGYGADKAAEILKKNGYEYGYVNLGLSSLKLLKRNVSDKGAPQDNMWAVHMSDPDNKSENCLTAFGKDTGVSTSGTYDLFYTIAGRAYSHLIDPKTGEPTRSDIVSVTILGENAGYDDALSTALCIMGKEKAQKFMNTRLQSYRVAYIVRNGDKLELVTNMADGEYLLNKG